MDGRMKILIAAAYVSDLRYPEFSRNKSGYGYMVKDIAESVGALAESVGALDETYLLTHQFSPYRAANPYVTIAHRPPDILRRIRPRDIRSGLADFAGFRQSFSMRARYLYYQLDKGHFIHTLGALKPDVTHIHGLTYQTRPYAQACMEQGVKFIVTLHGLNGEVENVSPQDRAYERDALTELLRRRVPVTVVSSGVRDDIARLYGLDTSGVTVIPNGVRIPADTGSVPHEGFHILCIGNVMERKNQLQIVRAWALLPPELRAQTTLHFCGSMEDGYPFREALANSPDAGRLIYHGFTPREKLADLWKTADLNVVASKVEGFGLSMIEGFCYGVPTITFRDLQAVRDIYSADAMRLVEERSDNALAAGIADALRVRWNHDAIRAWARNFSLEAMAVKYHAHYQTVMEDAGNA